MTKGTLLAYSTHCGSTAEIAEKIAETLTKSGMNVDLRPLAEVVDLSGYQSVIIGSPIHSGKWLAEAVQFVEQNQVALAQMPLACFTVSLRMRFDTPEMRQSVATTMEWMTVRVKPVSLGMFAGVMDYSKLSMIMRLQVQTKGLPEGDFRDWEAIDQWTTDVVPLLAEAAQASG